MAIDTFTLTIRERTLDGQNPTSVKVVVYPLAGNDGTLLKEIKDTTGQIVFSGRTRLEVRDKTGADCAEVTVTLPDPRDVTLNPTGFGFRVHITTNYFSRPAVVFGSAELDAHESGGVLYLEDVTEVDPAMFTAVTTYVEKPTGGTDGQALVKSGNTVIWGAGGGGGGAVDSVNGHTGVVVLGASDVGADASGAAATAQSAAISAAATDATTKASAAQAAAIAAAATDATTKVATETTRATTAEGLKAPIASPTFTGTVSGVTKAMVGLGSVDNTADTAKPVSTAQATADALRVRSATFVVAANDASTAIKAAADYVCDGTADDVQIQAALGALPAAGGRVVLSEGTFWLAAKVNLPAVCFTLQGQGQGATYIRLVNGVNDNALEYSSTSNVTFAKFEGWTLYGNGTNQTGTSIGIAITGGDGSTTGKFWDVRFQDIFVLSFRTAGIDFLYAHDAVFDHVIVEFCGLTASPTVPAVNLRGGDEAYFTNCLIKLNNGRGLTCTTYGTTFTNNHFVQNAETGLLIAAQNCTISNNIFDDNSFANVGSYPSLRVLNPKTVITGNTFFGNNSSPSYGVQLDSSATSCVVAGNAFQQFATAAINDLDTTRSNLFLGNVGANDTGLRLAKPVTAARTSGSTLDLTSTETQVVGDAVQIDSAGKAHLAKADAIANASTVLLCAAAVTGSVAGKYLLPGGTVKLGTSPSWTVGGTVYLSTTGTTGNTLTQTAPSGAGNVIQPLGVALAADTLLFLPTLMQVEHV